MRVVNKVLVVDDDIFLANSISSLLKKNGIDSEIACNLEQAYHKLDRSRYEIVILDRKLGPDDGTELIEYLREVSFPTKIMILSQLNRLEEKLGGLRLGADEYLAKPCCGEEILIRLEHLMVMEKRTKDKYLSLGNLKLDPLTGQLIIGHRQVQIRRREAQILTCLLRNKNCVVTRNKLIQTVWGSAESPTETSVDVYIRRIRLITKNNLTIKTVRGFGYMLIDNANFSEPAFH